jgi:hypothetical protein
MVIVIGPVLLIFILVALFSARGASNRAAARNADRVAQAVRSVELELMRANDPARYAAVIARRDTKRSIGLFAAAAIVGLISFAVLMVNLFPQP